MVRQLDGTSSVSILYICNDDSAVAALKQFFEGHMEFMKNKCEKEGPRKLLHYTISQSPEWEGDGTAEAMSGEDMRSTGRTIFHLFEIYETVEGLNHHWKEASQFIPAFQQLLEVHDIEIRNYTHMKIIQSL
tara:strand:- start:47 stop:442 length:396 start_codon:yes stop_codon:yes gene_type:complete